MDLVADLKLVLTLTRLNSLAGAGRELGVGTSSVARRLDTLEDRLGERLFNRTSQGVFLTQEGEARLASARHIVDVADEFMYKNCESDTRLAGLVRISCPAKFGEYCIAPVVATFLEQHPQVQIDLDLTNEVRDLDRDGIDLAVRIGRGAPDHTITRRIAPNQRILVASSDWAKMHSPIIGVESLNGIDALMLGVTTEWILRASDGTVSTVRPHRRFSNRSGDVVLTMCLAGLGVALKSAWEVQPLIKQGALKQILPGLIQNDSANIQILMPSRRFVPRRVRVFVAELETSLKAYFGPDLINF